MKYLNASLGKSTSATKKNFPMFTYNLQSKILGQLVTANITLFFEWHLWHLGMRIRQLIKERDLEKKKKKKSDYRTASRKTLKSYSNHFFLIFLILFGGV